MQHFQSVEVLRADAEPVKAVWQTEIWERSCGFWGSVLIQWQCCSLSLITAGPWKKSILSLFLFMFPFLWLCFMLNKIKSCSASREGMTMKFSQTPEQKATVSHPHRIQEESVKSYFLNKRLLEFTLPRRLKQQNNLKHHLHSVLVLVMNWNEAGALQVSHFWREMFQLKTPCWLREHSRARLAPSFQFPVT